MERAASQATPMDNVRDEHAGEQDQVGDKRRQQVEAWICDFCSMMNMGAFAEQFRRCTISLRACSTAQGDRFSGTDVQTRIRRPWLVQSYRRAKSQSWRNGAGQLWVCRMVKRRSACTPSARACRAKLQDSARDTSKMSMRKAQRRNTQRGLMNKGQVFATFFGSEADTRS